jgi:hypothetical protein
MTAPTNSAAPAPQQKPEEVTINEGLAKINEAEEALTPEQVDAMAEKAKQAAKDSQAERENKGR